METQQIDLRLWAYVRQTSIEIAQAIYKLADGDIDIMQAIWEKPTNEERDQILQMAWGTAAPSLTTLFWGWPQPFERPTDGAQ